MGNPLSDALELRLEEAVDYALVQGLLFRRPEGLVHMPFSLFPAPVSHQVENQLVRWTPMVNRLMCRAALDLDFLKDSLAKAAQADPFVSNLLKLLPLRGDGQPLQLNLLRADYLLHQDVGLDPRPLQVEVNTIAAGFAGASQRVNRIHRYLFRHTTLAGSLLANDPLDGVVVGISHAFQAYGKPDGLVVMVVQPQEKNILDQRMLEFALRELSIDVVRLTLGQIAEEGRLKEGHLWLNGRPVAVAYFRAGYRPEDMANESEWAARRLLESSSAVLMPTAAFQLAGTKTVQQALTHPKVLAQFLSPEEAHEMASGFAGIYALEEPIQYENGPVEAWVAALEQPQRFVLKPQREGGGHNLFGPELAHALEAMEEQARGGYILMDRIRPALHPVFIVREGRLQAGEGYTEIGRFGLLFKDDESERMNADLGYLARSAPQDALEVGVSSGFGCLDSLYLSNGD